MKVGYITTPYFGKRNTIHGELLNDELFYVKKHVQYINLQSVHLDKIYLICTFDNSVDKESILTKLKELCKDDSRIIIAEKENTGASYASWKHGLHMDNGDCDYIVLAEDDYCLYDSNAIEIMLNYFSEKEDLFYLCQYWTDKPHPSSFGMIPNHAALGSGTINNKSYHKFRIENNFDFRIIKGVTYATFYDTQASYLEDYRSNGILISDWREKHSSIFAYGEIEFGNPNGSKIFLPIIENFIN
jgi:hypothetical protein